MDIVQDHYESPELWAQKYLKASHFLSCRLSPLTQKVKNCLNFPSNISPSSGFFYTWAVFVLVQALDEEISMNYVFLVLNEV